MARIWVPDRKIIPYCEKFNATTSIVNLGQRGDHYIYDEYTILAYFSAQSRGEANLSYVTSISNGAGIGGRRINWSSSGTDAIVCAMDSTTGDANPQLNSTVQGSLWNGSGQHWNHFAMTMVNSVTCSVALAAYGSVNGAPLGALPVSGQSNGSGTINWYTLSCDLTVGNRDDEARTWNGEIAYVAEWGRKLSYTELEHARVHGPLSVSRDRLIFCWSGGRDHGPFGFTPKKYQDIEIGREAPNMVLG